MGNPSRPSKDSSDPIVMDDPVIKEIGDKYNAYTYKQTTKEVITYVPLQISWSCNIVALFVFLFV